MLPHFLSFLRGRGVSGTNPSVSMGEVKRENLVEVKRKAQKNANSLLGVRARPDRSRRELTKGANSDGDCSSQGTHLFLIGLKKWNKLWRKNKGKIKALMHSRSAFNRRPPPLLPLIHELRVICLSNYPRRFRRPEQS